MDLSREGGEGEAKDPYFYPWVFICMPREFFTQRHSGLFYLLCWKTFYKIGHIVPCSLSFILASILS